MSCSLDVVLAAVLSCGLTVLFARLGRRRRLNRLLRKASLHPDPDRRLAALFIAALDGLGHHVDLVLACTNTETADVVRTSLVDLVMEEEWKDERDERVAAIRAWARAVVAEQRDGRNGPGAPSGSRQSRALTGRPSDRLDDLRPTDVVAPDARSKGERLVTKRSATRRWARAGGLPEIDALEVLDALGRQDGRTRRSGPRRATSKGSGSLSADGFGPVFDFLLKKEGPVSSGSAGRARSTRNRRAGNGPSAGGAIRLADQPGDISAAV